MKYNKYATKRGARARARMYGTTVVAVYRVNRALFCAIQRGARQMSLSPSLDVPQPRRSFVRQLAARLFILFSRGEKEYKVVLECWRSCRSRLVDCGLREAASPRYALPRLPACLPASLRVRSLRGYLYVSPTRLGSTQLGSASVLTEW